MGEIVIPRKEWFHLGDWLTRQDELQAIMVKVLQENLKLLEVIAGTKEYPVPISIAPITRRLDDIKNKLDRDYPSFLDVRDFNTSKLTYNELKIFGSGFVINSIGGGFDFKLNNQSGAEVAGVAGDKYDVEFTNILVKGAGAGTGRIIYWRRSA